MTQFAIFPDSESEVMLESLTYVPGDKVTLSFTAHEHIRVVFLKIKAFSVVEHLTKTSDIK